MEWKILENKVQAGEQPIAQPLEALEITVACPVDILK